MRYTQILWSGVCIAVLLAWNTNVCGISSYEVDDIAVHDSEKMGKPLTENTKTVEEGIMTDNSIKNEESQLQYGQSFNYSLAIYKGVPAILGQFPWQAALTIYVTAYEVLCGGSLIRTNLVLTAAHCLVDDDLDDNMPKAHQVIVLLGTLKRENDRNMFVSTDVGTHSEYQKNPRRINDIGYVRLPTRVQLSMYIQPIQLPSGSLLKETLTGEMGVASGYGFANDGTSNNDRPLYYVYVRILDNNVCRKALPKIDRSHVCIRGKNGRGLCTGDSGGPLIIFRKNQPILIGVSSHSKRTKHCETINANAFTRVTSYIDWINNIEDKDVLCGNCKTIYETDFFDIEYKNNMNVIMTV